MKFTQKYAPDSEKTKKENENKKIISDDTFAIGEVIDELIRELKRVRNTYG